MKQKKNLYSLLKLELDLSFFKTSISYDELRLVFDSSDFFSKLTAECCLNNTSNTIRHLFHIVQNFVEQ